MQSSEQIDDTDTIIITPDLVTRASIKLMNDRMRLKKNNSKMFTLPQLCETQLDKIDINLNRSKKKDKDIKLKYAMKSLAIEEKAIKNLNKVKP